MCGKNKKDSILKIVAITSTVVLAVLAIGAILYKLFTKYFKITFECDNNCDECVEGCCDGEVLCECECDEPEVETAEESPVEE